MHATIVSISTENIIFFNNNKFDPVEHFLNGHLSIMDSLRGPKVTKFHTKLCLYNKIIDIFLHSALTVPLVSISKQFSQLYICIL